MRYNQVDARVVKTKESIKNALFDLIEDSRFAEITIKDLTVKANINRGTFYLHYQNLEELKRECFSNYIEKLYELFEESVSELANFKNENNYPEEVISLLNLKMFQYIQQNCKLLNFLWFTGKSKFYRQQMTKFVEDIFLYHKYSLFNKKELVIPKQFYISYVISSFMGIVVHWIDNDCKESPEEIVDILSTLNRNGILLSY